MENLKEYRNNELKMYVLANVLILLCIENIITWDKVIENDMALMNLLITIMDSAVILAILYSFVFLADALVPTILKNKIVYINSPLPGQIVFSSLAKKSYDERFTKEQVIEKYKPIIENLPQDKKKRYKYENSKWYSIYNIYRDKTMVYISNRDYLLCRDMTVSTIVIFTIYIVLTFALNVFEFKFVAVGYLLFMFVLTNIATRLKGKRFVNNVIAYDLQDKEKKIG